MIAKRKRQLQFVCPHNKGAGIHISAQLQCGLIDTRQVVRLIADCPPHFAASRLAIESLLKIMQGRISNQDVLSVLIAKAHDWFAILTSGECNGIKAIAAEENLLPASGLSPDEPELASSEKLTENRIPTGFGSASRFDIRLRGDDDCALVSAQNAYSCINCRICFSTSG